MPVVKTDKNGHSLGSSPTPIPATDQAVSAINHPSRAAQDRHGTQTGLRSDRGDRPRRLTNAWLRFRSATCDVALRAPSMEPPTFTTEG